MILELQRFIEFGPNWWAGEGNHTRAAMVFEPILVNTEYIATVRRSPFFTEEGMPKIEMCHVWMVDQGNNVTVDIPYETMRAILNARPVTGGAQSESHSASSQGLPGTPREGTTGAAS